MMSLRTNPNNNTNLKAITHSLDDSIDPWIGRSFFKDTKLRTYERYYRRSKYYYNDIRDQQQHQQKECNNNDNNKIIIIPNAICWRKYLRLIRTIIVEHQNNTIDNNNLEWIITESIVEYMDYRNQTLQESTTVSQERHIIQQLIEQHKSVIIPLPDLSIRFETTNNDFDEWDFMNYESMSIQQRSQYTIQRSIDLLLPNNNNNNTKVWILVDNIDDDDLLIPIEEEKQKYVKYITIDKLIYSLKDNQLLLHEPIQYERLVQIQHSCEQDYIRRNNSKQKSKEKEDLIVQLLSDDEIQNGIQDGTLHRGRFNVTKENVKEAFVTTTTTDNKTYFIPYDYRNKAFHQDIVVIQPLPESQWGHPIGKRRLVHFNNDNDDNNYDNVLDSDIIPAVPSARIVSIVAATRRVFVATLTDIPKNIDESVVIVVPRDVRVPKIRIRTRAWKRFIGQRIKVEIIDWDYDTLYPNGHCIEILGPIGDLETEIHTLLIENQVELDPFSTEAIACLPASNWKVTEQDIQQRKDLRNTHYIFSVDPPGCQDIDDTMHAKTLPNGDIEVGVHIADVTHFVQHNSALDIEAKLRGTTFYLVDRRFDMLPTILSSNLCSLHGGVDRLAVSVIWTLSSDLKQIKSSWVGRTIIHNCAAMTYDQADNILQGKPPDEPNKPTPPPLTAGGPVDPHLIGTLKKDLTILTKLARLKRADREQLGGAVDLTNSESGSELKFTLENGIPTKVASKEDKEIHHTIAELMIMANTHVANQIHTSFPDSALLRIHRSVEEARLEGLKDMFNEAGIDAEGLDSASFARVLKEAQSKHSSGNNAFRALLLNAATRAMTEAQYVCTGDREIGADLSHYGLGLQKYTHFTSPIRRYADVVVHKQLLASINQMDVGSTKAKKVIAEVTPLKSLPESNVISILAGQGLESHTDTVDNNELNDSIDDLIEGASSLVLGSDNKHHTNTFSESSHQKVYSSSEVSTTCERLNLHNRLAKQSSYECQGLFLSLYFKDHVEKTQAVVTNLKENGFFVYVPKFDISGPVYVKDSNGHIQIDPILLGLRPGDGLPPTMAFTSGENCRRFPDGNCRLVEGDDKRLEVNVPGCKVSYLVRLFDVVNVKLTCDDWDVRARVPSPRFQLVSKSSCAVRSESSGARVEITSTALEPPMKNEVPTTGDSSESMSMFGILSSIVIRPVLADIPIRTVTTGGRATDRTESMKGRIIYGNFVNPDTRSAAQEAAQQAAAAEAGQRRANLLAATSRRTEYDTAKNIEKSVTLRMQRLAADKRNTRKSKAK